MRISDGGSTRAVAGHQSLPRAREVAGTRRGLYNAAGSAT